MAWGVNGWKFVSRREEYSPGKQRLRRRNGFLRSIRVEALEDRYLLSGAPLTLTLEMVNDTGSPGDGVTSDAEVGGVVYSSSGQGCHLVEFDLNGDGAADASTFSGANDQYFYDLGAEIESGEHTVRARAAQWDNFLQLNLYSPWQSLSFNYTGPELQVDREAFMWGHVPRNAEFAEQYLHIDYNADGWADTYAWVGDDGYVEYDMSDDLYGQYGEHTIQIKHVYVDWDRGIYDESGEWQPLTFEFWPEVPAPVINSFAGREVEDGVWIFEGFVSYDLDTKVRVEFDGLLANHNLDVDLQANPDGYFSYSVYLEPNESGPVYAQIFDVNGDSNQAVYMVA